MKMKVSVYIIPRTIVKPRNMNEMGFSSNNAYYTCRDGSRDVMHVALTSSYATIVRVEYSDKVFFFICFIQHLAYSRKSWC